MSGAGWLIAASLATTGAAAHAEPSRACARALASLALGARPVVADFEPAPCPGSTSAAFRYDLDRREIRAARAIGRGEVVPALPPALLPLVRPGDRLRLTVRVGPVSVEREVVAIQTGRTHGAVFVQSADGAVFAARMDQLSR